MKKKNIKPIEKTSNEAGFAKLFEKKTRNQTDFETLLKNYVSHADLLNAVKERKKQSIQKASHTRNAPPEEQIDLHGLTAREAEIKVDSFLYSARKKGLRKVAIITGKGLHSERNAVLPDIVEARLVELKKKRLIHHWEWENKVKSRSGSVLVIIKK